MAKEIVAAGVSFRYHSSAKPRGGARRPSQNNYTFQDFFDRYFGQNPDDDQGGGSPFDGPGGGRQRSLGSGVVLNANGYIITNFHVVDGAERIRVRIKDDPPGVLHDAKLVGSDRETDLAVIK